MARIFVSGFVDIHSQLSKNAAFPLHAEIACLNFSFRKPMVFPSLHRIFGPVLPMEAKTNFYLPITARHGESARSTLESGVIRSYGKVPQIVNHCSAFSDKYYVLLVFNDRK